MERNAVLSTTPPPPPPQPSSSPASATKQLPPRPEKLSRCDVCCDRTSRQPSAETGSTSSLHYYYMQSVKKPTPLPSPDLPDGWRWASISPLKHPTHSRPAGRRGPANSEAGPAICYSDAGGAKARHLRPGQSHEPNTSRLRSVPSTEPDLSIGLYTMAATDPTAFLPPSFPPFKKKKR